LVAVTFQADEMTQNFLGDNGRTPSQNNAKSSPNIAHAMM